MCIKDKKGVDTRSFSVWKKVVGLSVFTCFYCLFANGKPFKFSTSRLFFKLSVEFLIIWIPPLLSNSRQGTMPVNGDHSYIQLDHDGWVKSTFTERHCVKYVADDQNTTHCLCGQTQEHHIDTHGEESIQEDNKEWHPITHTLGKPTDAFGSINFLGGSPPNKAQYIRLAYDSSSDDIFQLLTKRWEYGQPKLVISVHGDSVQLNSQLKCIFPKGLVGAAKITGESIST